MKKLSFLDIWDVPRRVSMATIRCGIFIYIILISMVFRIRQRILPVHIPVSGLSQLRGCGQMGMGALPTLTGSAELARCLSNPDLKDTDALISIQLWVARHI